MDHSDDTNSAFFPFFIGDLLGYKIFYYSVPVNSRNAEEIEVVSASHTTHSLIFLEMYTNYSISILAFNPAGEGPRSDPVSVKTLQGIPEPPVDLKFNEITMNTLKVSWDPPVKPNGEILGYVVAYVAAEQDESKCYCAEKDRRLKHQDKVQSIRPKSKGRSIWLNPKAFIVWPSVLAPDVFK